MYIKDHKFTGFLTGIEIYKLNLMKIFCISRSNGWTDLHGFGLKMNALKVLTYVNMTVTNHKRGNIE